MAKALRTELGKRVRGLRKLHGWSQEELGERADLHPTYVGGIERGERNVAFENLVALAKAFNLTLSQFFDFEKGGPSERDQLQAKIVGELKGKSERDLELLLAIIGAIEQWSSEKDESSLLLRDR